ncbi:zf-HC2 domain-containing protein [Kitasatospora sp. NPDC056446]|uniref:zf-HC2 domain-containing protein n=1 Tax=Kitasatospora sp. NPDC056446 TaxID=3345819 RepID=UPI0036BA180F
MSAEHASAALIADYARGDVDLPADTLWALESHLETCAPCRARLAACLPVEAPGTAALVDTVRAALEPRLDAAARACAHASVRRRRPAWVTAWLTPVMAPWLAMTAAVTLAALLLDEVASSAVVGGSPMLLLAPALPLCGVAAAWSPALDPAHELTVSTARAGLPLLLRRTTGVLLVVLPGLLLEGRLTGTVSAAQWLLPSLAFTSAALALGSVIGVARAAAGLAAAWGAAVVAPALATNRFPAVLEADLLPGWALLLVLGTGAVAARRNAYSTR